VHEGWDRPKPETFERFFRTHPQWRGTPPVNTRFHWKWYYAMHQAGDDLVADQVAQYRQSMLERERWSANAGLFLPSVAVQLVLHRLARTDLREQLEYHGRIEGFHGTLRKFYYPYIFHERKFGPREFALTPVFQPSNEPGPLLAGLLAALALLSALAMAVGLREAARAERND